MMGRLGAGAAGAGVVPTAALAVVDPQRQGVACVFTMGGLFGNGRVIPGTGLLAAGGGGASGIGGPVLVVNNPLQTTLFAAGGSAIGVAADLEDAQQRDSLVAEVLDRTGRIDILVNNAGFADYSVIEQMGIETFDRTLEHYLRTPFVLTRAAIPHMRKQGAGWIVNIGSVTGLAPVRPYRDYNKSSGDVVYASAKAALHRFTQGVAAEVLDANIAVNCVGPSTAIRTPGAAQLIPDAFPTEPVEYLAETVLAMCHLPAAQRTGLVAFSLHYPWSLQLPVHTLDGREVLPPLEPPVTANPNIIPAGL